MLFAIAWILPIAEAADPVVCQPGEQSVCQASSAYGLLAGYSPTTNISDVALIDLNVRNLGNATDHVLALSIYETGLNYSLQAKLPTGPLDLRALSTQAKGMMFDCAVGCPLKHYQMYFDYYGDHDYADKWVRGAILQTSTAFSKAKADADFSSGGVDESKLTSNSNSLEFDPLLPWRWEDLNKAASQGATLLTTWMWSIGMFEEAVNHCDATDNTDSLAFWDKGVAYYTGSLEGPDGSSKSGTYGELTYAYAERRCVEFKTCGVAGGSVSGGSRVNFELATLFYDGQRFLKAKQCSPLRALTYTIVQLMTVPLVQSTLRSAYLIGFNQLSLPGYPSVPVGKAEGAACAAALLPLLHYCDSSSGRNAAAIVAEQMTLGSPSVDFTKVKNAVEQSYQCLGITCIEVGGLWNPNNGTGAYRTSASPCVDSQQSQTYIEVYTPIAGYSPGGNVVEHNEVTLDQKP